MPSATLVSGANKESIQIRGCCIASATFGGEAEVLALQNHTVPVVLLHNEDDADEDRYLMVRAAGGGVAHAAEQIRSNMWKTERRGKRYKWLRAPSGVTASHKMWAEGGCT